MFDWKKLSPHLPVAENEPTYVPRPFDDGAARLAMKVRANIGPIAIAGPVGCGKSTELAATVRLLAPDVAGVMVRLDRYENLRVPDVEDITRGTGRALIEFANRSFQMAGLEQGSLPDDAIVHLRELKEKVKPIELALLCDGLEKMQAHAAFLLVKGLLSLRKEVRVAVVVPLALVTGPESYALSSEGVRLFPIRAVPVGQHSREGERFLKSIAMQKLGVTELPAELDDIFELAAKALEINKVANFCDL